MKDIGAIFDAAMRRRDMAARLGCRPETVALLEAVTRAAGTVWRIEHDYRKARQEASRSRCGRTDG